MEQSERRHERFSFGDFVLDPAEAALTFRGEPVPLAPREFDLLQVLVSHRGHLVHKETLIKNVWHDTFVSDSNLLRNISVLRKHLGHDSIRTVPKRGYLFALPVRVLQGTFKGPNEVRRPAGLVSRISGRADFGKDSRTSWETDASHSEREARRSEVIWARITKSPHSLAGLAALVVAAVLVLAVAIGTQEGWFHTARTAALKKKSESDTNVPGKAAEARILVLNEGAHSVSTLKTLDNVVESTLPVNADPRGAAILPDGSTAYISLNGTNSVVAMNTRNYQISRNITVGNNPVGVAANPRPPFVYVANNYSNTVSVIDSRTNEVIRQIPVGSVPTEIAVSPDGTRAIVTNQSGGTVTMIDSVANVPLGPIRVGSTPVGVAFTPDSSSAWVTLAGQEEIAVIDVATEKVVHRVHVGRGPVRVAITHDGRFALVSNFFSSTLTFVDTASMHCVGDIPVGLNPVGVVIGPAGVLAYVVNYGSNTVSVIDIETKAVVQTVDVGAKPMDMTVLPCYTVQCSPPEIHQAHVEESLSLRSLP